MMGWVSIEEQLPDVYAAIDEAESAVASALTQPISRFRRTGNPPEPVGFDPNTGSWSIAWWEPLSGPNVPYRVVVFQLEVVVSPANPLASAWIAIVRADEDCGSRVIERELWRSSALAVHCPLDVAAAIRRLAAELSEHLGCVDLEPYLSVKQAEPPP